MAWIKTIPFAEADKQLREAIRNQRALFPHLITRLFSTTEFFNY